MAVPSSVQAAWGASAAPPIGGGGSGGGGSGGAAEGGGCGSGGASLASSVATGGGGIRFNSGPPGGGNPAAAAVVGSFGAAAVDAISLHASSLFSSATSLDELSGMGVGAGSFPPRQNSAGSTAMVGGGSGGAAAAGQLPSPALTFGGGSGGGSVSAGSGGGAGGGQGLLSAPRLSGLPPLTLVGGMGGGGNAALGTLGGGFGLDLGLPGDIWAAETRGGTSRDGNEGGGGGGAGGGLLLGGPFGAGGKVSMAGNEWRGFSHQLQAQQPGVGAPGGGLSGSRFGFVDLGGATWGGDSSLFGLSDGSMQTTAAAALSQQQHPQQGAGGGGRETDASIQRLSLAWQQMQEDSSSGGGGGGDAEAQRSAGIGTFWASHFDPPSRDVGVRGAGGGGGGGPTMGVASHRMLGGSSGGGGGAGGNGGIIGALNPTAPPFHVVQPPASNGNGAERPYGAGYGNGGYSEGFGRGDGSSNWLGDGHGAYAGGGGTELQQHGQLYGQQYGGAGLSGGGWDGFSMTEDERRLWGVDYFHHPQGGDDSRVLEAEGPSAAWFGGESGTAAMTTKGDGRGRDGEGGGHHHHHPALPDELTFSPTSSPTGAYAHSGHRPLPHFN